MEFINIYIMSLVLFLTKLYLCIIYVEHSGLTYFALYMTLVY